MPDQHVRPRRRLSLLFVFPLTLLSFSLAAAAAPEAFADTCTEGVYYRPGQFTGNGNYTGLLGALTDPLASLLPGDSTNNHYDDHILIWGESLEENIPNGQQNCGPGGAYTSCWVQAGVGMGYVGTSQNHAINNTQLYQPYYEAVTVNKGYNVNFYPGISINQGVAIVFEVFNDGLLGQDNFPQFKAEVEDSNNTFQVLGTNQLYYGADHAAAISEVLATNNSTCPTFTNGSPWQTFGTDSAGNYDSSDALELLTSTGGGTWSSSDPYSSEDGSPHYWYESVGTHAPAAFITNGPASGPP